MYSTEKNKHLKELSFYITFLAAAILAKAAPVFCELLIGSVRIVRNQTAKRNVEYLPMSQARGIYLEDGDEVSVVADKMPGTISVSVMGEHGGQAVYILPYGSTMMSRIQATPRSNLAGHAAVPGRSGPATKSNSGSIAETAGAISNVGAQ